MFFKTAFDFLSSKLRDSYAISKLAREIDLEWQSMQSEFSLPEDAIDEVTSLIKDFTLSKHLSQSPSRGQAQSAIEQSSFIPTITQRANNLFGNLSSELV